MKNEITFKFFVSQIFDARHVKSRHMDLSSANTDCN